MIKVLITDDHPVVRRGIRQILEEEVRISLIEEAVDGKEMTEKLKMQDFDVILLDISLPGKNGLELIDQIKKIQKAAAVIMLSIHSDAMYIKKAFQCGASGYLSKSSAPEELISAIHLVARGQKYFPPSLVETLANSILYESDKSLSLALSARELEVLNLFALGKTVAQIAEELFLSPKTISTYRGRLLSKLELKTTADLIRFALMERIVKGKLSSEPNL